jgi:hypothetical protein
MAFTNTPPSPSKIANLKNGFAVVEIRMIFAALLRKIMRIFFKNFNENIF